MERERLERKQSWLNPFSWNSRRWGVVFIGSLALALAASAV